MSNENPVKGVTEQTRSKRLVPLKEVRKRLKLLQDGPGDPTSRPIHVIALVSLKFYVMPYCRHILFALFPWHSATCETPLLQ